MRARAISKPRWRRQTAWSATRISIWARRGTTKTTIRSTTKTRSDRNQDAGVGSQSSARFAESCERGLNPESWVPTLLPVPPQPEHDLVQVLGRGRCRRDRLADREPDLRKQPPHSPEFAGIAGEEALPQARERHRDDRHRNAVERLPYPRPEHAHLSVRGQPPFRENADQLARGQRGGDFRVGAFEQLRVFPRRRDRDGAHGAEEKGEERHGEYAVVHHPANRPAARGGDHEGVHEGHVVAHENGG